MLGASAPVPEKPKSNKHTEDKLKLCPYCRQLWPHDTINEHMKYCPEDYYECDLCLEKVLVKDKDTHFNTQCKMILKERISSDLYECPLCGETLLETDKASHESFSCKTLLQNNEGPLFNLNNDDSGFGDKGAKPKHPKASEFVIPKAGKCSFCKTTLSKDILLYHEKECLHKPIRCSDCYSTVLLKDYDKHHCRSPKRKDKGSRDKRIQKAEKSEPKYRLPSLPDLFASNVSHAKSTLVEKDFDQKIADLEHPEVSQTNTTETCMNCKEKIPVHELSNHKQVCAKILIKHCKHCDEELYGDDSEENHLQNCKIYNHSISETDLLSKHFKDLLTNENCWDTVLQVGSKEFKAHKIILIARSSVFSAMFQHDTEEKKSGIVKIADCDPDYFQQFLEYLYCGKLKHFSSDIALHLYTISDKYNVQELKIFCIKYLIKNITVQNICEVVILADMYDEAELFSATEDVFNKNFKEIVMTSEWETLMKNNFRLANKLLIKKALAE